MSPLTRLYLLFSWVSGPLWRLSHRRRLARGKEHPERLREKYGEYKHDRPEGPLIWFHALSVGESLALVPLIELALTARPGAHVVLTTSTATSIAALERVGLPDRCFHILMPIDTPQAVGRFLDHWRPDVAGFAELDFWPRLMVDTQARGIPMVLINSRMPEGNFKRRQKLGGLTRDVLRLFERLLVQDEASRERFADLGADLDRIEVVGALKSAARPLPADAKEVERLQGVIASRPTWLAAATIGSEHPAMIAAHVRIAKALPDALMILAPRNVSDGDEAESLARGQFDRVARRSRGEDFGADTQVYVADTIGEMGLWYRLAPVSFLGHSLGEGLEGKNPYEAAALGSVVLHGPEVSYFSESYAGLTAEGAAREVCDSEGLADAVIDLQDPARRQPMRDGAERAIAARRGVLDATWRVVDGYLD
ncbi:MAG: 3-deoxy-D-manno-octulosonic acid transferase [Silicimonas sp.]|nr:3-deoxy-D-manno-octulosonic acid transferase [Silicimonas sp.]